MRLFSPAKINLFLRVTNRREDGYHELSTLMQAVDLGDFISLDHGKTDFLSCTDRGIESDERNIVWKALLLFRQKTSLTSPVHIKLEKKIPVQAGLGGGSSNAATTLWGLNALFGFPVSEKVLQEWSIELGADVPFFFSLGTAHCYGIGEVVQLRPMQQNTYYLHKPLMGLSTPQIFRAFDLHHASREDRDYHNDLEQTAIKISPSLARFRDRFASFYRHFFMTGSGSGWIGVGGCHPEGIEIHPAAREVGSWYTKIQENMI